MKFTDHENDEILAKGNSLARDGMAKDVWSKREEFSQTVIGFSFNLHSAA